MPIGTIGKYERLDVLGHGASGVVYLAWDTLLRRQVALKEIRAAGPELDRVLSEARVLDRLRHPHIVAVHSVDQQDGVVLIDMELVRGRNLADLLRARAGEPLPLPEALRIALAVLDALAYAHERRILHRDVKPGNLLIGGDGETVKLTDFGLAEALGSHSVAGGGGTYPYMAPEDFAEDAASDTRADLWAVGVMVYEMLTGRRPFAVGRSKDPFAWKRAIETETPAPVSRLNPAVPAAVDAVLERALAKDKTGRFPDARAFADALRAAAGVAPGTVRSALATPAPEPAPVSAPTPPEPVPSPGTLAFPDGTLARSLDELLAGAARHWDFARRALSDGRFAAFLEAVGEVYIAELARELTARADLSPDRRLREFLERSQPEGQDAEERTVPLLRRARRATPAPVPAPAPAPTPPPAAPAPAPGNRMRWWFFPVLLAALAPGAIAGLNVAGVMGLENYSHRLLMGLALSGVLSAMLLLLGIGVRLPVWARGLCLPPTALGVTSAGVLAATLAGPSASGERVALIASASLAPLGVLVIQAATARRLWRLWLALLLVGAAGGSLLFAVWG